MGWNGADVEGTIDLEQKQKISYVSLDVMNQPQSWIFMPSKVTVFTSDDNISFEESGSKAKFNISEDGVTRVEFRTNTNARYIRIKANNFGLIPKGYAGAGSPAWIFVDEVIVK